MRDTAEKISEFVLTIGRRFGVKRALYSLLILGLLAGYALVSRSPVGPGSAWLGLSLALFSTSLGFFFGFLFAIPRRRNGSALLDKIQQKGDVVGPEQYRSNTNLEDISDWLTKIVVGVGLVELLRFPDWFGGLCFRIGRDIGQDGHTVGATILFFFLAGFLLGYFFTRLEVPWLFSRAELTATVGPKHLLGLIHMNLYESKPEGFEAAIEYIDLFEEMRFEHSPRLFTYAACAYAQKYGFHKATLLRAGKSLDESELKMLRGKALENTLRAAENEDERELLEFLYLGENPQESDLKIFREEEDSGEFPPDFAKAVAPRSEVDLANPRRPLTGHEEQ